MRLHDLKPAKGAKKSPMRVGRGNAGKGGKTAGRGQKGQRARNTVPVWFEGGQMPIQRRVPKFGGFTPRDRTEYAVINVSKLAEAFDTGASIGPEEIAAKGLVRRKQKVKVLAHGDISKALTVRAHRFSKVAKEKIEAAGGTAEVL
jgi:large subunit ribosomal protein L15